VAPALKASDLLEARGLSCAVVDARFVKPLDEALLLEVAAHVRGVVTVEEHSLAGGFGSAVLELLAQHGCQVPVQRLGVPDEFVEHGKQSDLRAALYLDAQGIADRAARMLPGVTAVSAVG